MHAYCEITCLSILQIWRLITALLWYPVNFRWLMMLYFLYSYSQRLETGWPRDGSWCRMVYILQSCCLCRILQWDASWLCLHARVQRNLHRCILAAIEIWKDDSTKSVVIRVKVWNSTNSFSPILSCLRRIPKLFAAFIHISTLCSILSLITPSLPDSWNFLKLTSKLSIVLLCIQLL